MIKNHSRLSKAIRLAVISGFAVSAMALNPNQPMEILIGTKLGFEWKEKTPPPNPLAFSIQDGQLTTAKGDELKRPYCTLDAPKTKPDKVKGEGGDTYVASFGVKSVATSTVSGDDGYATYKIGFNDGDAKLTCSFPKGDKRKISDFQKVVGSFFKTEGSAEESTAQAANTMNGLNVAPQVPNGKVTELLVGGKAEPGTDGAGQKPGKQAAGTGD